MIFEDLLAFGEIAASDVLQRVSANTFILVQIIFLSGSSPINFFVGSANGKKFLPQSSFDV